MLKILKYKILQYHEVKYKIMTHKILKYKMLKIVQNSRKCAENKPDGKPADSFNIRKYKIGPESCIVESSIDCRFHKSDQFCVDQSNQCTTELSF